MPRSCSRPLRGAQDFDDVTISFVDNAGITAGNETVVYDDSDPDNKTLDLPDRRGQYDGDQYHRCSQQRSDRQPGLHGGQRQRAATARA